MIRRFALLPIALLAVVSIVLAACSSTPQAPALTDPKEIIAKGSTSLASVKTVEFTGSFTGNLTVPNMGAMDLSTIKLAGAVDMPNKTAKLSLDAPTLMGSKIDAIVVGGAAYVKVGGLLAGMMGGGSADKYSKTDVSSSASDPFGLVTDTTKITTQIQEALAKLPTPPTKGADEKCGDQDCYHVTIKLTAAEMQALSPGSAGLDGDLTFDMWTRKSDYRPAKLSLSATSAEVGTFGMVLEIKYDTTLSIVAPPADQIAP